MRIHLKIMAKGVTIPFDHQHLLTGTIHKWMGWNKEHGKVSLYVFSILDGAKATTAGLKFEKDSSFFISSYDEAIIKQIVAGIQLDPTMFKGLKVYEIIIQEDPDLSNRELFFAASPIFIKRKIEDKVEHIFYNDPRANEFLKETLETKMQEVGLVDETLEIRFATSYPRAGTKKITYNGIENKASWCPVFIKGKKETKLFAWKVGVGNSTGIGFGAIK